MQDDRWEYRIWPEAPDPFAARLRAAADEEIAPETRTDHYLLSADDQLLAKIRGGERFEVKQLIEARYACERWMLAISTPFPIESYTLEALMGEAKDMPTAQALLDAAASSLRIVAVEKQRRRFRFDDSQAEITHATVSGQTSVTIAIEAPDFDVCSDLVGRLDLGGHDNIDYGSYLRGVR